MAITVTDEIEKKSLLIGYKWNINKRSLKAFAKKSGAGDGGGGYMAISFKEEFEDDPYMAVELGIDINQFPDNQVLLNAAPPAAPVEENLYLNFDEFYAYLVEVVNERIAETPSDKAEYEHLLSEVKTALGL
ncbi:hypothetical protein Hs30E_00140 [Lactococcus hodotermopsidis]|uniref:Uncharacterized protein n=1 Tax=Pseudolactococcus hodotermopsidis TaxID=2709157 RepID=A0A6A0BA09_9LACT|nr:hypothetical protein [Lactococcus hodotermopsidis]GFH41463.1 hypothetical protein Hs30E_00140 [Lactococcus hodotermopsidis]